MRGTTLDQVDLRVRGIPPDQVALREKGTTLDQVALRVRGTTLDQVALRVRGTTLDQVALRDEACLYGFLDVSCSDVSVTYMAFVCRRELSIAKHLRILRISGLQSG